MNHTKINLRADVEIHVSLSESLANRTCTEVQFLKLPDRSN